jgi:hypothetical protein
MIPAALQRLRDHFFPDLTTNDQLGQPVYQDGEPFVQPLNVAPVFPLAKQVPPFFWNVVMRLFR